MGGEGLGEVLERVAGQFAAGADDRGQAFLGGAAGAAAVAAAQFSRDDVIAQFRFAFVVGCADRVGVAEAHEDLVEVLLQEIREAFVVGVGFDGTDEVAQLTGQARRDAFQPRRRQLFSEVPITRGQSALQQFLHGAREPHGPAGRCLQQLATPF